MSQPRQPRVWVFKIDTKRGWEFDEYFRSRTRGIYELGDEGWIRSAATLRYLREEVKRGDLFLCYELDRKQVVGLARAASDGRDVGLGSLLDFCPPHEAVRLQHPLTRHPDLDHILAFTPHRGRGTVQKIDRDEFARLRRIILRKNPQQTEALQRLLGETGSVRNRRSKSARFVIQGTLRTTSPNLQLRREMHAELCRRRRFPS